MTSRRFLVSGIVQGVGFRAFARRQAGRFGVAGYAANLADGRVEVVVVGSPEAIDGFLAALRGGPAFGRVDRIDATEATIEVDSVTGFEIR